MKLVTFIYISLSLSALAKSASSECTETRYTGFFLRVASVTCSNVPGDLQLDHQHFDPILEDLIIVNSSIPILPSNSSLTKLTRMKRISLQRLGIEKISPGAFDGLTALEVLNLPFNKLTKISKDIFGENLATLKELNLFENLIEEIESDSFSHLLKLGKLLLGNNKLKVLPANLLKGLNILELNISNNPLENVGDFGAKSLVYLDAMNTHLRTFNVNLTNVPTVAIILNGGQIETFDFGLLSPLEIFSISSNNISLVQNWDHVTAESIYMYNNQITELEISQNVKKIFINNNKIQNVRTTPSNDSILLTCADLSYNEISEINSDSFRNAAALVRLNLEHNRITEIRENAFVSCKSLWHLDLSHNKIETIEPNAFCGASSLAYVDMSHNNLKALTPESLTGLHSDVELQLYDNGIEETAARSLEKLVRRLVLTDEDFSYDRFFNWSLPFCKPQA